MRAATRQRHGDPLTRCRCPPAQVYLREEEFNDVFGMSRAEFNAMPKWKRQRQKQAKGLF